jgi:epoxyqueuosine reductase
MATPGDAFVNPEERAASVKDRARELGFDSCGITDLSPPPHRAELDRWLKSGYAGTMSYMRRQQRKRAEPAMIVPGATRAVVVTRNYHMAGRAVRDGEGKVAKYARGRDYHDALGPLLERLAGHTATLGGPGTMARAFLDAGPVPERELAQRAGLGWIGKNTMLIDPKRGSFFFIGTVLTDADLALDSPFDADRCGRCRRCLDACPTEAFPSPWILDSRLCISYLTIEYRGELEPAVAARLDGWVFGCDICQDVCPWNHKFASPADDPALEQDPSLSTVSLEEMSEISDEEFERRYGWTAMERPGAAGMRRNARGVLQERSRNSRDARGPSGDR